MSDSSQTVRIVIASYLEPHHVDRIRALNPRLEVGYEPHLLPRPRFAADHVGHAFERPEEDEKHWVSLLAEAEILFDFDRTHLEDLPERAPSLRWIQATSAGIGQIVARHRYVERMPNTVFTTASGVHATPLAEYTLMSILIFRRRLPQMLADQRERRWELFASTDLTKRSLAVVGMGSIGTEVARVASEFGMRTIGVKRTVAGVDPASLHLETLYAFDELHAALRGAEHLVLSAPHTPETEGLIGAAELALLAPGAILVNVAARSSTNRPWSTPSSRVTSEGRRSTCSRRSRSRPTPRSGRYRTYSSARTRRERATARTRGSRISSARTFAGTLLGSHY